MNDTNSIKPHHYSQDEYYFIVFHTHFTGKEKYSEFNWISHSCLGVMTIGEGI